MRKNWILSFVLTGSLAVQAAWGVESPKMGEVTFVAGAAYVEAAGVRHAVKVGDAIHEGEVLQTGKEGHIHLQTVDKGFVSLRPNSRVQVEVYRYDAAQPEKTTIRFVLDGGVMRSISGQGAQSARQNFRLNTPVAAIGIKGTDFTVLAEATLTRAIVSSGAIVVSGFGDACSREAQGPCSGEGALLLTAQQTGKLLEILKGQQRPVLLDAKVSGSPDTAAPPAATEPVSKTEEKSSAQLGGQAVRTTLEKQMLDTVARESQKGNVIAVPVEQPTVAQPQINWGRWSALAGSDAGSGLAQWLKANGDLIWLNTAYVMARANSENLTMPATGAFDFKLDSAEAMIRDRGALSGRPASVDGGTLAVDFGKQTFTTHLDVTADKVPYQLDARGSVTNDGKLSGNYPYTDQYTNTYVSGALAGTKATQAGYLFERSLDEGARSILGITTWHR